MATTRPEHERTLDAGDTPIFGGSHGTSLVWSKRKIERPNFSQLDRPRLIVSVDAEEEFNWSEPFSSKATAVRSMARQHLAQAILERYKVVPIYLCDFPIADQEPASQILREWVQAGRCVIGTQLHPWVNPPLLEEVNEHNSYPCNLPFDLLRQKLGILTDRITETIGVRPVVYKAGRSGAGPELSALLKPLGYTTDMSINPVRDYRRRGGPDHTSYPHVPFWLDAEHELLEIPITANVLGLLRRYWLPLARLIWSERAESMKLTSMLARFNLMNRVVLTPEGMPLAEAKELTRALVQLGHRVFSLYYHSPSLMPGSTPYVRNDADVSRFLGWLDAYLDFFFGELAGIGAAPAEIYDTARAMPVTRAAVP